MKKKRIGIISFYYKNYNYGGTLQSYALCKVLQKKGYLVEQICFDNSINKNRNLMLEPLTTRFYRARMTDKIKMIFNFIRNSIKLKKQNLLKNKILDDLKLRISAFDKFTKNYIPHSDCVYNENNITESIVNYDVFITGSDQVWNPIYYHSKYFLDFVPSNKIKISYAASLSQKKLTIKQENIFRNHLKSFNAISLREEQSINLIQSLSETNVQWVLDPTLLLSIDEWNELCSERIVETDYLFCYFLGDDKYSRTLADKFAKKHNLTVVTLPYLLGHYRKCDELFGDKKLFDISPQQFLSLIKHASYVFTDSFHVSVFSSLYKKQFFVFPRGKNKGMDTRINELTKLFNFESHFINTLERQKIEYIESIPPIEYSKVNSLFEEMKKNSINYLEKNIGFISEEVMTK